MKKIILFRANGSWIAKSLNDPEVIELFGTDEIPTSFTSQAEPELVRSTIQRLNPTCLIEVK